MFKEIANKENATFNNILFTSATIAAMKVGNHETGMRLLMAAKALKQADGPSDVARLLNVSPQTVTNWTRRGVSKDGMLLAQRLIGVNATWIESGEGEMVDLPAKHKSPGPGAPISAQSNGLFKGTRQNSGNKILDDEPKRDVKNVVPAPRDQRHIPVISYVQAGMMTEVVDPFAFGDGYETILTDLDLSAQAFALIIEGSSMLPQFNEGDKVIIDPAVPPRPGDFVVAKTRSDETTFMKYRPRGTGEHGEMVFELVPLNDDFPTLHSERDHLRLIGVMIEHRQYRRP